MARSQLQNDFDEEAHERLAKHLRKHGEDFFTFLYLPGLDATSWRAEHTMRFGVILRKVWGGNRTSAGSRAQPVLDFLSRPVIKMPSRWRPGVA